MNNLRFVRITFYNDLQVASKLRNGEHQSMMLQGKDPESKTTHRPASTVTALRAILGTGEREIGASHQA